MIHEITRTNTKRSNRIMTSKHKLAGGVHALKFWAMDPGVVLEKLLINTG